MSLFSPIVLATSMLFSADPGGGADTSTVVELDSAAMMAQLDSMIAARDSIAASFHYTKGKIDLLNGVATLTIPDSFKFLDAEQSRRMIVDVWRNPPSVAENVQGIIMPESGDPYNDAFAFIVEYNELGYVSDEDADKIDYDELMTQMKADDEESNKARHAAGAAGLNTIGWAAKPFYDKEHKVLHWAMELEGEGSEMHTLNYNVRILGRKGVMVMNAVAGMDQLASVQANIPAVLGMTQFNDGYKYEQFDSKVDDVAAWTLGGLVAGKVLVKAGLFAGLLKFLGPLLLKLKVLWIALIAGLGAAWRWITGKKKKNDVPPAEPPATPPAAIS